MKAGGREHGLEESKGGGLVTVVKGLCGRGGLVGVPNEEKNGSLNLESLSKELMSVDVGRYGGYFGGG